MCYKSTFWANFSFFGCVSRTLLERRPLIALGSRLTLDFPFFDFFGVLQEHIQFFFFWVCFQNLTLKFCFSRSFTAALVVVALGSRLTLDFPFIDFFGVLQDHILSHFFFFWVCFQNLTYEKTRL